MARFMSLGCIHILTTLFIFSGHLSRDVGAFITINRNIHYSLPTPTRALRLQKDNDFIHDSSYSQRSLILSRTRLEANDNSDLSELPPFEITPKRAIYIALWSGLIAYTFLLSPGGSAEAAAKDSDLIKTILSTPFDGTVSPAFVAVFNALGILPAIYASLLLPAGKDQRVPVFPFVFSSFFLGFFGIGPYLLLREPKTGVVTYEERGYFLS